jgi:ubiquinol-cytochrome c reductase cytochrome c1 subunit
MKKLFLAALIFLGLAGPVAAAGGGVAWDKFPAERSTELAALQNGARIFVNHCLNCHSAAFMRYNRLADIGLTEAQIKDNLMFTTEKVGEVMKVSMDPKQAKDWFGGVPPDLTLIARSRSAVGVGPGVDYLYTFMRTFYRDDTKPTGWNNLAYPNVGMPHVLWEKQGIRNAKFEQKPDPHDASRKVEVFAGFDTQMPGQLSAARYDQEIADLVAFLQWMGEPARSQRVRIGVVVLIFLGIFTVIAWQLNRVFWKDIK